MTALAGAFNKERALVEAFYVIVKTLWTIVLNSNMTDDAAIHQTLTHSLY